ncbi:uncharacterized protein LOC141849913 [Brevipalpus obovatus]|uniref:uncharacterized protein LOC141849913 n=1 Tax=Brevipalpus obovatus TaxID=246614 RepID=UPI003D9DBF06
MTSESNKPWYCRKGRGDRERTERLIAARKEREARQSEANKKNARFFNDWDRQSQWLTPSSGKRSVPRKVGSGVPYDLDFDPSYKKKVVSTKKEKSEYVSEEVTEIYQKFLELKRRSRNLRSDEIEISHQLENLLVLQKNIKDKRENWVIKDNKLYYNRFAKDRLRAKIFLVSEQLNFYHVVIECLVKSTMMDDLHKEEADQMNSIIESSLEIIDAYVHSNDRRNSEIILLYNEEAEKIWLNYQILYENEEKGSSRVVDSVIGAFFDVLKCKLEENLKNQENVLMEESQTLKNMSYLVKHYEQDEKLHSLLDLEIDELVKSDDKF